MDENTILLILAFILVLGPSLIGLLKKWADSKESHLEDKLYRESHRVNSSIIKLENDIVKLQWQQQDIMSELDRIGALVTLLEQEAKAKNIRGMRKKNKTKY